MKNPRSAVCDWAGNILLGLCKCVIPCEEVNAVLIHADTFAFGVFRKTAVQTFGKPELELAGIGIQ